jgi:hypothetical protein
MWIVAVVMMVIGAITGFLVGVAYGQEEGWHE